MCDSTDSLHDKKTDFDNPTDYIDFGVKADTSQPAPTKSALKKLRRKEKFDSVKTIKRQEQRVRRKKRYADARETGVSLGPSRKSLKRNTMQCSTRHETVVIDCDFDDLMADRDIFKLVNQIQRCYSVNRRCVDPLQFHVTSVTGKTLTRLESVGDYKGWDIYCNTVAYTSVFPKEKIVYLSSESENVLTDLESDKVYVIGGLVDHNHHKGLCHRLAIEKGIQHARLPIDEYVQMQTRKVLTIDQVFTILVEYLNLRKWEDAFYRVIPKRKGAVALTSAEQIVFAENSASNTNENYERAEDKEVEQNALGDT